MKSIQQLREDRKALVVQAHAMLKANESFTDAQMGEYQEHLAKIDAVDAQITAIQQLLDREGASAAAIREAADRNGLSIDEATHNRNLDSAVFNAWVRGGSEGLAPEHRERLKAQQQEARRVYGALAVGTDSAGGFTVPTDFSGQLIERMRQFGGVRELAAGFSTDHGRDIEYPTSDGTTETGELLAENAPANELDASFGVVTLRAFKWSSKFLAVPFELMMDTQIDLEAFLLQRLATRIGRSQSTFMTTGTGTAQPQGVVTAAGTVAAAGVGAITYDDLIELQHAVDPAYRAVGNMAFMLHDTNLKVVRKLKDTQGHPLWVPNLEAGASATLLGVPVQVNQQMAATLTATSKSVLFGDFSQYIVRDVMGVQLFRFTDSAFVKLGQVGFLAWARADGRVIAQTPADAFKVLLH